MTRASGDERDVRPELAYWLVMPAAGVGLRLGGATPKQYLPLAGIPMLERSLALFLGDARCLGIALVLGAGDGARAHLEARLGAKVRFAVGGAQRSESVRAGLQVLAPQTAMGNATVNAAVNAAVNDWVLVHDAARPLLSGRDLDSLLRAAREAPQGAILAEAVADTLKRADEHGCIAATQERSELWRAQTPQMFRHGALCAALDAAHAAGRQPTDEAQALEWQGVHARLVAARDPNFKITTSADFALAEALLTSTGHS